MIGRKSALIVGTQMFVRILGWFSLLVLAKLWGDFGPQAMGVIGFALSFLAFFNMVTDLGFSSAHIKKISEGKDLGMCIGTFTIIKIISSCAMVIIALVSIFAWESFLGGGFVDATTKTVVYVCLLYYFIGSLNYIFIQTFYAKQEIAKGQIVMFVEGIIKSPLTIIIGLAGVSVVGYNIIAPIIWPDALKSLQLFLSTHVYGSLAMTYVAGVLAVFIVGLFLMRKYPIKKPNYEFFKEYMLFALPLFLITGINTVSANVNKIMIGFFWTSTEVGYYFTIEQITQMLLIIYSAVSLVAFPILSEYHSKNNLKAIQKTTHDGLRYLSMVIIPPIVVLVVFARPIISIILSDSFIPAVPVLILLSLCGFFYAFNSYFYSLIVGMNKPRTLAKITIIIAVFNIAFNYFFIPRNGLFSSIGLNGASGAALATLLSTFIGVIFLGYSTQKMIQTRVFRFNILIHLFSGLFMGLILYIIGSFIGTIYWYELIILTALGLCIYLGILYILKEFNKNDMAFFLNILNLKEMVHYIRKEVFKR